MSAFNAVVAVTVTPFDSSNNVDGDAYRRVVARMVASGVDVVTVNGNTGEFYALRPSEVELMVKLTVEAAPAALVVAGVGYDVDTAIAQARSAHSHGAKAIMVHQPVHPYQSSAGWIAYHQMVAEAVPQMHVLPYVRDPAVTGEMIRELAEACPNVSAVKYAVPDVLALATLVGHAPHLTWLCGLAESWTPFFWLVGARGFTSGLANVAPELSLRLLKQLKAGNLNGAMQLWARLRPFETMRAGAFNVSVVKEALAQQGLCERAVRPPATILPNADRDLIKALLAEW